MPPNLDSLNKDALWTFWREHDHASRQKAAFLFPEQPKGYIRATRDLANYAANKATAMACRAGGRIAVAQDYERMCDSIYYRLPDFAQW